MLLQPGNTEIQLYFQHGWAFTAQCWQEWQALVVGCHTVVFDRGYWGYPVVREVGKSTQPVVMIAHSLGLHFLQDINLEFVDLLVIIGGFRHFHGEDSQDGCFSRRHVHRMHRRLAEAPLDLIHDFYNDCSYPYHMPSVNPCNIGLLAADLDMLDSHVLDVKIFNKIPKIIMLHGQNDRIVPIERALQLSRMLPDSVLHCVPDAGHGLPFTHPKYCVELIALVVDEM